MNDKASVELHRVDKVLLADGWHLVKPGSFRVGEFVLIGKDHIVVGFTAGLQHGAQWEEADESAGSSRSVLTCPLSAILAVQSH